MPNNLSSRFFINNSAFFSSEKIALEVKNLESLSLLSDLTLLSIISSSSAGSGSEIEMTV